MKICWNLWKSVGELNWGEVIRPPISTPPYFHEVQERHLFGRTWRDEKCALSPNLSLHAFCSFVAL